MRRAALARLTELAAEHENLAFVASDIGEEVVSDFRRIAPERIYMEGISEAHIIGLACGLAKEGDVVFVNTIASFLSRRAVDQIATNLCLEQANVKLLSQGGGVLYGPFGPTHHANEDFALMRAMPGMTVLAPCDTQQVKHAIDFAYGTPGPFYIRLSKGNHPIVSPRRALAFGQVDVLRERTGRVALVSCGTMVHTALKAADQIQGAGVIGVSTLKPFPTETLLGALGSAELIVTVEEHSSVGGLASCMCEMLVKNQVRDRDFMSCSLPDAFIHEYGEQEELLSHYGLSAEAIAEKVNRRLHEGRC